MVLDFITYDWILSVGAALIILIATFKLEHYIRNLKKTRKGWGLVVGRVAIAAVYIVGITAALIISGITNVFVDITVEQPTTTAIIEVAVVWLVAKFITRNFGDIFLELDLLLDQIDLSKHAHVLIKKVFTYFIYTIALIFTLNRLGWTDAITALLAGAGFAGIVVGFAAKDVLSNLLAGMTLLLDKPFKIGDYIEIKAQNLAGTVNELSLRSTEIVAVDNTIVNIPNAMVSNNALINYTRNRQRRFMLPVGIAYESDISNAISVIKKALETEKGVINPEKTEVLVKNFGASSVDLEVRVWVDTKILGPPEAYSRLLTAIKVGLDKAGIEIPYPRRVMITSSANHHISEQHEEKHSGKKSAGKKKKNSKTKKK